MIIILSMQLKMRDTFFVCICSLLWFTPLIISWTNGLDSYEKHSCYWLSINFFGTVVLMNQIIKNKHNHFYFCTFLMWILLAVLAIVFSDNNVGQFLILITATVDVVIIIQLYLELLYLETPKSLTFLQPLFFLQFLTNRC